MASLDLTTAALVKSRLGETGSSFDTVIGQIIDEVSDHIEVLCGREFKQQARTEYYDGTGRSTLVLRQGPLVSVASVYFVEYLDAGDNSRTESTTEVYEYERVEGGLASEGHVGPGWIEMISGTFLRGAKNYKVTYTAGLSADTANLPPGIVRAATNYAVMVFNQRQVMGLMNQSVGAGGSDPIPLKNLDDAVARSIAMYRVFGVP